jgi:hypothetical protein
MSWHVQFRRDDVDHVSWHQRPEDAIEAACQLIDTGHKVYGIGTGPLSDTIDTDQIAHIYALWVRAKRPFGLS